MLSIIALFVLLVPTCVFGTASSINDLFNDCAGQEILMVTEAVRVDRHVVNITVPACSGYVPRDNAIDIAGSLLGRRTIQARSEAELYNREIATSNASPSECTNPSICQCGQPFFVTCGPGSSPPDPNPTIADCENLASVLRLFHESIGPTFVQTRNFPNPTVIDFSTCRAAFGNINTAGTPIEYCWDGLADNVVALVNGCIAPQIAEGGDCTATNGLWEMAVSGLNRMP